MLDIPRRLLAFHVGSIENKPKALGLFSKIRTCEFVCLHCGCAYEPSGDDISSGSLNLVDACSLPSQSAGVGETRIGFERALSGRRAATLRDGGSRG